MLETIGRFFTEFWEVLRQMSPYLLFGFMLAGIFRMLIPVRWVEKHLGGEGFFASLKAAAVGVPLPVCSCGVIPLAASLRKNGAGAGPTTAFLISTPETGVDSILATWALLGPVFTVFRVVAALFNGLLGGVAVSMVVRSSADTQNSNNNHATSDDTPKSFKGKFIEAVRFAFIDMPRDLSGALIIGLIISGLISVFVPVNFFATHLSNPLLQMLLMLAVGIPMYVCSTASIPIAAALVINAGISPGAALVFLISGPATNAATVSAVVQMLGWRAMITYLASVIVTSLAAGIIMDTAFAGVNISHTAMHQHSEVASVIYTVAAIVLLVMLLTHTAMKLKNKFAAKPAAAHSCCEHKADTPAKKSCCHND